MILIAKIFFLYDNSLKRHSTYSLRKNLRSNNFIVCEIRAESCARAARVRMVKSARFSISFTTRSDQRIGEASLPSSSPRISLEICKMYINMAWNPLADAYCSIRRFFHFLNSEYNNQRLRKRKSRFTANLTVSYSL